MVSRFFKNDYIYSVFTKILMFVIAFFHSIVLARFLGSELKGMHATVYSIVSVGMVIINISCQQAYPFFRREYGKEEYFDKYMTFISLYHFIIICISILLASFIIKESFIAAIAIILIPISGLSVVNSYVCLIEFPKARNTALLIIDLLDTLLITCLLIFDKPQKIHILIIFMFPLVLKLVFFSYKNRFYFNLRGINFRFVKEIVVFSIFPMISMLLTMLNYKIDILMLNMNSTITAAQIGVYSIGISLADKVIYIPDAVKEILLSKLTKGKGEEEVARSMRLCFFISICAALLLIIVGEPFVNYLYGYEYSGAYIITLICVLGTVFMVFFKMISQYNNVHGKQKITTLMLLISNVLNIILNLILIPRFGTLGAAYATLISHVVCGGLFILYFHKISGISIRNLIFVNKNDCKLFFSMVRKK